MSLLSDDYITFLKYFLVLINRSIRNKKINFHVSKQSFANEFFKCIDALPFIKKMYFLNVTPN